jgi:hypothetical protein
MATAAAVAATPDSTYEDKYTAFDHLDNVDTVHIECLEQGGLPSISMEGPVYWKGRDENSKLLNAIGANKLCIPRNKVWKKCIPKLKQVASIATKMEMLLVIQYESPWDQTEAFPTISLSVLQGKTRM